jgi:hypothetical protein
VVGGAGIVVVVGSFGGAGTVVVVGSFGGAGTVVEVGSGGTVVGRLGITVVIGRLVVGSCVGPGAAARACPAQIPRARRNPSAAAALMAIQLSRAESGYSDTARLRFAREGRRVNNGGAVAVVKRDYYEVLGVPRDAEEEAIRRAYYVLAREAHPDVADSPDAEEEFRELAEAYSVLSKREARLLYDRYGYRGRGNLGFDEALWEARPPQVARGENVHVDLEIRGFEATEGTRRLVSYEAVVRCQACMGRGDVGSADPECEYCGGTGRKRTVSNLDVAELLQIEPCPECVAEPCSRCYGTGTVLAERRIRLLIPPGVEEGTQLRVSGDGNDAGAGSIPGDLLVRVHVLPAPADPRIVRYAAFVLLTAAIATLVLYLVR